MSPATTFKEMVGERYRLENRRAEVAKGGRLRAASDIGSHWLDLATYLTGARVTEVLADLYTFVPTRFRPRTTTATFSTPGAGQHAGEPVEPANEDAAAVLLRFSNGGRGPWPSPKLAPAARTLR